MPRRRRFAPSLSARLRRLGLAAPMLALFACALLPSPLLAAAEVQAHGLVFERWVRETFFPSYSPENYTGKWDVPGAANHLADPTLAGLPVNPKATKLGGPVGLGDALRQFDIEEPFILVLGFWEQSADDEKRFVQILAPRVEPAAWRALWGPVTRADLERLDALVKDRSLSPVEARLRAQEMKKQPPFSGAVFVLNPKIDARGQRRLQCSLRYADVFRHLAPDIAPLPASGAKADADASAPEPVPVPTLWGVPFPGPVPSPPRQFTPPGSE